MQKIVGVNLLLLFLILVSCVISISSSYTDLHNTQLLHSIANLRNSKVLYTVPLYSDMDMQRGNRMSSRKRFFQDLGNEGPSISSKTFGHEDINAETVVVPHTFQDEHVNALDQFDIAMTDHQQSADYNISTTTMYFEHLRDEGTSVDPKIGNNHMDSNLIGNEGTSSENTSNDNENTTVRDVLENSFSFGQALYQKAKQGVIIQYKDHGDNTFQCVHCNAYYWRDEENTQGIYTCCCQQGQVRLPPSNPTPQFLEQLLDSKNGQVCKEIKRFTWVVPLLLLIKLALIHTQLICWETCDQRDFNRITEAANTSTSKVLSYLLTDLAIQTNLGLKF